MRNKRRYPTLSHLAARLRDARFIVGAAVLAGAVAGFSAGGAWIGIVVVVLVVLACLLPSRSQRQRLDARRRAEEATKNWRAERSAILDALDMAAYLLGPDGTILHGNEAAARAFGPAPEEAHLSGRIRSPGILDMVREALETGRASSIEHSERIPSERWYNVRVTPVDAKADGGGRLFLLTFQDMTEARRMDRMRSDFVANASHELRTPLASLTGFVETLQGPAKEDPAARDRFLSIMLEQAERMSRLIEDLLSLSRLELRAHVSPSDRLDLVPLIGHVVDTLTPLAGELGVTIGFSPPQAPVMVAGDRDELIQVFQNLVENACKYGQPGKVVDIVIEREGGPNRTPAGMVDVSVRDYGPGIPPEHVPRLTERFYRVSVETSRMKKGTGLGLAIVKHILTRHRARLLVRSELGEGSVFTVRFSAV